mgnify:CR=1 FL=1
MNRFKAIVVSLIFFCSWSVPVVSSQYETSVIVAMDFSSSYFAKERFRNIQKNFNTLGKASVSRNSGAPRPLLFQVIPIDELSQSKGTVCEYTLQEARMLGGVDDDCDGESQCSSDYRDFKTFLKDICVPSILKRKVAELTDIEGALSLAGQLSYAQRADNTYLFIFSDMAEYRYEEVISTPPDLEGMSVVVVCGGVVFAARNEFCMSTKDIWTERLTGFGAESVDFVVESGKWDDVARDLFE